MAGLVKSCYIPKIVKNRRWLEALQSAICPKQFLLVGDSNWINVGLIEMWDKIKKTVTFILLCPSDTAVM